MSRVYPQFLSILFDLLAIVAIVYGFSLIWVPLGFIFGGVGLLLVSRAIDPPKPQRADTEGGETWA